MLRRPTAQPAPAAPLPRGSGLRLLLLLLVPLVLLIVGGATGLLNHARGWVMFGLACVVLLMVAQHHRAGGSWLVRMVAEYTVIGVLAVLLVTGTGVTKPALPHGHGRTAAGAAQLCPATVHGVAASACDLISDLWSKARRAARTAKEQSAKAAPTTTTTPRGRHR